MNSYKAKSVPVLPFADSASCEKQGRPERKGEQGLSPLRSDPFAARGEVSRSNNMTQGKGKCGFPRSHKGRKILAYLFDVVTVGEGDQEPRRDYLWPLGVAAFCSNITFLTHISPTSTHSANNPTLTSAC